MPNRILKESIRYSESIDQLSFFEEAVFYRLITCCDDYGRMDARPAVLGATLFPLKKLSDAWVESAIRRLEEVGILTVYTVESRPYLEICHWERHQTVRAKRSKYPAPAQGQEEQTGVPCAKEECSGAQVVADAPVIRSGSEAESFSQPQQDSPTGAPSFGEVYRFFAAKHIDTPFHEASVFLAYNAKRGWDCLPDWRATAELWVLRRLERAAKGNSGGFSCED